MKGREGKTEKGNKWNRTVTEGEGCKPREKSTHEKEIQTKRKKKKGKRTTLCDKEREIKWKNTKGRQTKLRERKRIGKQEIKKEEKEIRLRLSNMKFICWSPTWN